MVWHNQPPPDGGNHDGNGVGRVMRALGRGDNRASNVILVMVVMMVMTTKAVVEGLNT